MRRGHDIRSNDHVVLVSQYSIKAFGANRVDHRGAMAGRSSKLQKRAKRNTPRPLSPPPTTFYLEPSESTALGHHILIVLSA